MRSIVGTPARGGNFFPRDREVEKIIERIRAGNNLQIAAPRRIGKTSILFHLLDNQVDGYTYVYIDTERVNNEQDFYKKLLKEILRSSSVGSPGRYASLLKSGSRFLKRIKSISVLGNTLELDESAEVNYYEELSNFLAGFELENSSLVLLIDEFPQTILNIIQHNKGDQDAAIQFLQSNRELRLDPDITPKVRFIYTGSIGLNHTVASINASAFINDLNSVEVEPLTQQEARTFIRGLLREKSIAADEDAVEHLLLKIEWLIPFHIQLLLQEVMDMVYRTKQMSREVVDGAFDSIISIRHQNHFDHYYSRLKIQFKGDEFRFADGLLQRLATSSTLTRAQAFDLAVGYKVEDSCRRILDILMYDGYINNIGNPHAIRFNSPIVRMWWQKFICKETV
jgi:hypothetical protein